MKKSFIPLAILTFHLFCSTTMGDLFHDFFPSYVVHIINNLPTNSAPLQVCCQSKDDDLGIQTLGNGEDFNWKFAINFTGTTLFFWHFYWDTKDISFDVFDSQLDSYCYSPSTQDNYYYWSVKADGFYISNGVTAFTKINNWTL
ncbi:hypothetical protein CsSME_00020245 [Camellia sinensis var. sinensis]